MKTKGIVSGSIASFFKRPTVPSASGVTLKSDVARKIAERSQPEDLPEDPTARRVKKRSAQEPGLPKIKRRLQHWKTHAARLGSEAPKPLAQPLAEQQPLKKRMGCRRAKKNAKRAGEKDVVTKVKEKVPRRNSQAMIDASESAAKDSLLAGDTSLGAVQRALDLIELPSSANRTNVIPNGQTEVQGLLMGLYSYGGTLGVSAATTAHPQLCKLLVSALRAIDADFPFTSIQLNFNYASRPHVDKNNLGVSYIVGFGGYEGGELWLEDKDAGDKAVSCTLDAEDYDVSAYYPAGSSYVGRIEDINNNWTQFDGNKLHCTQPFSGSRYSVIFFTCDQYRKVPDDVRASLRDAGISFAWDSSDVEELLHKKMAEKARLREELSKMQAEKALEERMRRGRCVARIWADGWGHQCTAVAADGEDMCSTHIKGDRWKTHGRFGGDLPPAKRAEMASTQRKWLKQGKLPPPDEPWTQLVDVP